MKITKELRIKIANLIRKKLTADIEEVHTKQNEYITPFKEAIVKELDEVIEKTPILKIILNSLRSGYRDQSKTLGEYFTNQSFAQALTKEQHETYYAFNAQVSELRQKSINTENDILVEIAYSKDIKDLESILAKFNLK